MPIPSSIEIELSTLLINTYFLTFLILETCFILFLGFDTNLATVTNNSRVIGNTTHNLLNGNRDIAKFTGHIIGNKSGITVKLGSLYSINNIKLKLYDGDLRYKKNFL